MALCKMMVFALLVGTAMSASYPELSRIRRSPSDGICHKWCGNPPHLTCCDPTPPPRKCPVDNRPIFNCNRKQEDAGAFGNVSGPAPCQSNSDCKGRDTLCCWDSCLGYKKCTNP